MALQISLTSLQQDSCTDWVLTDATGTYSASNTDGWSTVASPGVGNLTINNGSVTFAELTVTFSSGSSVTIDIIDNWLALTGLATVAFNTGTDPGSLAFTLTSTLLGATIADGIYEVTYQVGNGATYATSTLKSTITYTYALYCLIECCVEQRLAQVPDYYTCEECDNDFLNVTTILWTLLQSLKMAACTASTTKFETILETLQNACLQAGCDCS